MNNPALNAFVYLYATSLRNSVVYRLRRLRQPKYLIAALAAAAYFYFLVFRQMQPGSEKGAALLASLNFSDIWLYLASVILMLVSIIAWIFPSGRATLRFTEAEMAFLLPAPISRRSLIRAKLLRSQLGVLFAVLVISLLVRRGGDSWDVALYRAVGGWLVLSTVQLHFLAVSFARERLLSVGVGVWPRRLLAVLLLAAIAWVAWRWGRIPLPQAEDVRGVPAFAAYLQGAAAQADYLKYLLMPFRWVLEPWFSRDVSSFVLALGPALAILLAHYLWVVRANVAFEEASMAAAAKRAQRLASLRSGNLGLGGRRLKPRSQPWALAAHGANATAYLWKTLIEYGALFRLRTVAIAALLIASALHWTATTENGEVWITVISGFCALLAGFLYLLGPMFVLRGAQRLLDQLDIAKTYPMAGWQLILGQLLGPLLVICCLQALLLWTALIGSVELGQAPEALAQFGLGSVFAVVLITPPLVGMLLCVPMGGALYFPSWLHAVNQQGGGIETMGQRILFFAAYFLALALSLVPATLIAALVFWPASLLMPGWPALMLATLAAAVILLVEFVAILRFLGGKLDRFDIAVELRQ